MTTFDVATETETEPVETIPDSSGELATYRSARTPSLSESDLDRRILMYDRILLGAAAVSAVTAANTVVLVALGFRPDLVLRIGAFVLIQIVVCALLPWVTTG